MARNFSKDYYKRFIPKGGIPERIFKYSPINDYLKSSLNDGYLWFSKPEEFNDPFDCYTELVDFRNPEEHIKYLAATRLTHLFPTERQAEGRRLASNPALINETYRILLPQMLKNIGVCCFTLKNDHILMWSHYAAKHQGLCMIFDPLVDIRYFLTAEVGYTEAFRPFNYFDNHEDALMKMAVTKSLDWAYESEIRIVLPEQNGKLHFPKNALKGVIFGCRTTQKDIEEIKVIVNNSGYGEVIFQKACMERNQFRLTITDI